MNIRMLQESELLPALHLVWEVFAEEIAPLYTPEGVFEFQKFIKYENIFPMYQRRELIFFGSYDDSTRLSGVIAVKAPTERHEIPGEGTYGQEPIKEAHISLFFVRKDMQGQGIGRALYQTVYNYAAQNLRANRLTVNAAPTSVPQYIHFGMQQTAEAKLVNGIHYVPMGCMVIAGLVQPAGKKKKVIWIVTAVMIVMILLAGLVVGSYQFGRWLHSEAKRYSGSSDFGSGSGLEGETPFEQYGDYHEDSSKDSQNGLEAIPEYQSEDISYQVDEEQYIYNDDTKTSTVISFEVRYPKVSGLSDQEVEKKVNESLKNMAMDTVDKIYNHPSDEIKETVLGAKQPALASFVQYKVCYASRDLLSVVYEDYSYRGSSETLCQNLRTCNISLKDGTVYQVKDVVEISDAFVEEWLKTMRSEADNEEFLSELSEEQLKKALNGDDLDGVYVAEFFMDRDGIEIGFDLNYKDADKNNPGDVWVTAPFRYDEIQKYQKGEDFWSLK